MNQVLKAIHERYSCRDFLSEPPTREQLGLIADAALAAPSAMNSQPWHIVVVNDKSFIDEMDKAAMVPENKEEAWYSRIMDRGGKMFYNAPCAIYIAVNDTKWALHDSAYVSQNITLAAHSLGLASVICAMAAIPLNSPKGPEFLKKLNFPDGYIFGIAVLIGKPAATKEPHQPDKSKVTYL